MNCFDGIIFLLKQQFRAIENNQNEEIKITISPIVTDERGNVLLAKKVYNAAENPPEKCHIVHTLEGFVDLLVPNQPYFAANLYEMYLSYNPKATISQKMFSMNISSYCSKHKVRNGMVYIKTGEKGYEKHVQQR